MSLIDEQDSNQSELTSLTTTISTVKRRDTNYCWVTSLKLIWRLVNFNFHKFLGIFRTHNVLMNINNWKSTTNMNRKSTVAQLKKQNKQRKLEARLTWTAQLRKQLFCPGPLRSPFVSLTWWSCWFEGDVKMFIGKFLIIGGREVFDEAKWGWNVVPTVILLRLSLVSLITSLSLFVIC